LDEVKEALNSEMVSDEGLVGGMRGCEVAERVGGCL